MNISELIGRLKYIRDTFGVEDVYLDDEPNFDVDCVLEGDSKFVTIRDKIDERYFVKPSSVVEYTLPKQDNLK